MNKHIELEINHLTNQTRMSKNIDLGYMSIAGGEWSAGYFSDDESADEGKQLDPNEVVIPEKEIGITFTYPLSKEVSFAFTSQSNRGFTRQEISELIMKKYRQIYDEENETSMVKESLIPGMFNRAPTAGKYGIWGHCIEDLQLHSLWLAKDGTYHIGVDS